MDSEKLIEQFKQFEFVAYNYNINGEVLGMDCTEFECIMADAATALEQLQAENDRLRRERDDAIRQLKFFAPCAGCKWYRGIKGCAHELGCDTNHDYYEFVAKEE